MAALEDPLDVILYKRLLKLGVDLCVPIEQEKTAGKAVHSVGDSTFAADVAKTNLAAILNQHGLANVRSL